MPSHRREAITFYLTISPWLIGFLVFILAPMAIALYLSFARWDLFGAPQWIGLENYARMARDPLFAQALKVTTIYTLVYVPMEMIGGISLALLVNQKVRGVGVFRTIFYLPSVLAGVAYVVLPISTPALATVVIFTFQASWNDFLQPLIFLQDQSHYTLTLGLNFFRGSFQVNWAYLMAASLVVVLPVVIVFFLAQRLFIQGIAMTGIKG